jgi:hypothetical protein
MLEFTGHFDGHSITPDEHVEIPVNVPLRVTIEPAQGSQGEGVNWQRLLQLADECAIEGPENLAEHHDHYAHGKPLE